MPKLASGPIESPPIPKGRYTLAELIVLRQACYVPAPPADKQSLAERFLLPPFSVLDARQGYWQKRKRAWLAIGIQSELGRGDTASTSARVGPDDAPTYRTIGGSVANNGLLGESEQARSHYKKANATPGGSPLEAASLGKDGKTVRGDGRGRPLATTFGSGGPGDLAAGFKGKTNKLAPGGTDANSCWLGTKGPVGENGINKKADNRAIKDHAWPATHGKKIPQMGVETPVVQSASHDGLTVGVTCDAYRKEGEETVAAQSGTSIFDPVICELAYRWFTPVGGLVLDPFAGGSVRGVVAAKLGRRYRGIDLRQEQTDANQVQADDLCPGSDLRWVTGDASDVSALLPGEYDFVFSCPPYADLERYSDDPRDLSTMPYSEFLAAYRKIIADSCAMLRQDRFACFVVGDVRDRAGNYRNFVGDTVRAFRDAGLELYNEAVLVTSVGSLPIRVGRQFAGARKLGKTHQNVLVFVKGDGAAASRACGSVDLSDLAMPEPCAADTVALVVADLDGVEVDDLLDGTMSTDDDLVVVGDSCEAVLVCDILRCRARAAGLPAVRVYVSGGDGWECVPSDADLCYVVDGVPYLNGGVFAEFAVPPMDDLCDSMPLVRGEHADNVRTEIR